MSMSDFVAVRAEIEMLRRLVNVLGERVAVLEALELDKRRPGRPPKDREAA